MNKRAGFTLIELLTVIAIAGVLAAISMPGLSSLGKTANNKDGIDQLVSTLRQAQAQAIAGQGNIDQTVTFTAGSTCKYSSTGIGTVTAPNNVGCLQGGATPSPIVFHKLTGATTSGAVSIVIGGKTVTITSIGIISSS